MWLKTCGKDFWDTLYTDQIGSHTSCSNTEKGGIKFISHAPVQIPAFILYLLDRRLNFFTIIEHFLSIRPDCTSDRIFLQIRRGKTNLQEVFKRQNLRRWFFESSVKTLCNEAGVKDFGLNEYMINHRIRFSMTALLINEDHTDSSIILSISHLSATTLARYHNLKGLEGCWQQQSSFQNGAGIRAL